MHVQWVINEGHFFHLEELKVTDEYFDDLEGVYIIWSDDEFVKVGHGSLRYKLAEHKKDSKILERATVGLRVSWALVDEMYRQGIVHYLLEALDPYIRDEVPNAISIRVNLPGE